MELDTRSGTMDWITGLQRSLDYIEEHITEELDYDAIAGECFYSGSRFQRVFSILCGYTLGDYIRWRRLSLAGEELASGEVKVIDAALKYGYDSPDSFARAFVKFHGSTPSNAKDGASLKFFSKLSIQLSLQGGQNMNYRIEQKAPFSFYGVDGGELSTKEKTHGKIELEGRVNLLHELFVDPLRAEYGNFLDVLKIEHHTDAVHIRCDNDADWCEGKYIVGFASETAVDYGCRTDYPAHTWAVFTCRGPADKAVMKTWKAIYAEFLPVSGYYQDLPYDFEVYPNGDITSEDYTCEIWIPVAKK